jgi:hypothetical protein
MPCSERCSRTTHIALHRIASHRIAAQHGMLAPGGVCFLATWPHSTSLPLHRCYDASGLRSCRR